MLVAFPIGPPRSFFGCKKREGRGMNSPRAARKGIFVKFRSILFSFVMDEERNRLSKNIRYGCYLLSSSFRSLETV